MDRYDCVFDGVYPRRVVDLLGRFLRGRESLEPSARLRKTFDCTNRM